MAKGKVSLLNEPDFAYSVAQAYCVGMTQEEIANEFEVSRPTINGWLRDPRVTVHIGSLTKERITRITRKVDTEIENRLEEVDEMDTELLLKIRKEMLSKAMVDDKKDDAAANPDNIKDAIGVLENNPELMKLLNGEK
jgi:transcriptional regulator with XRE-family HTH domain